MPSRFTITIDTREQRPPSFKHLDVDTEVDTVKVFDFCLKGDTGFAVERKGLSDFVDSISVTKRLDRELRKVDKAREQFDEGEPIIYVVEASYSDIRKTYDYSRRHSSITPNYVLSKCRELEYNHGVHVSFVDNKRNCAEKIFGYLKNRWRKLNS